MFTECCIEKWTWQILSQFTNNNEHFQVLDSPWKSTPDNIATLCLNISNEMAKENKSDLINKSSEIIFNISKQSGNFKNPSAFLSKAENNLSKHLKNHHLNLIRTDKD